MVRIKAKWALSAAVCSAFAVTAAADAATSYTVASLGVLAGGTYSEALGINDAGEVVGYGDVGGGAVHSFIYGPSGLTDLGVLPGGSYSYAYGINASGQVAGYGDVAGGAAHGFVGTIAGLTDAGGTIAYAINSAGHVVGQSNGSLSRPFINTGSGATLLDTTGYRNSIAYGINDSDAVVGYVQQYVGGSGYVDFAASWIGGTVSKLPSIANAADSYALAINNSGTSIGYTDTSDGGEYATVWSGPTATNLGLLAGDDYSQAYGLNAAGVIVGESETASGSNHAVIWSGTTPVDLNTLIGSASSSWQLFDARGINDVGQIVGTGYFNGQYVGYVLTPVSVPEPSAAAVLCAPACLLGRRRRIGG